MDEKKTVYRGVTIVTVNPGQGHHTYHQVPAYAQAMYNDPGAPTIPAFSTRKAARAFIDRRIAEASHVQ